MNELQQFIAALRQPGYVHVLLNPIPIYGLAAGLLVLIAGLAARSRGAQTAGLLLVLVAGAVAWPVTEVGENAAARIAAKLDSDGKAWLRVHEERAETALWFFGATAVLALAGLVAHWRWPKPARWLTILTFAAGLAAAVMAGAIGHAGGQIRHSEFRTGAPPGPNERKR